MLTGPDLDRAQARYDATAEPDAPDTRYVEQARHERATIPSLFVDWLFPELIDENDSLDPEVLIAALRAGQSNLSPAELIVALVNCDDPEIVFRATLDLRKHYHDGTKEDVALRAQELSDKEFQEAEEAHAEGVEAFLVSP